jgi:hypothetical protein
MEARLALIAALTVLVVGGVSSPWRGSVAAGAPCSSRAFSLLISSCGLALEAV